ncbi:hypothetical protein J7L87_01195 [bacterium]|nr:hypothetical protein [bacterium]
MKKLLFLFLILFFIRTEGKILLGEKISIKSSKEEVFTVGEKIEISGELQSEFIGIGKEIKAENISVNGDFIGLGIFQSFKGNAENDIYLAGNSVFVEGKIGGSLTGIGKKITLLNSSVNGNLRLCAEFLNIAGKVKGKTIIWGRDVILKGVFNNVVIYGNEIKIKKGTVINGNLTYYSPEKILFSDVKIKGKIEWKKPVSEKIKEKTPVSMRKIRGIYTFFSLLFPFLFMLFLAPNLLSQTSEISGKNFFKSFITGLALLILTSLLIIVIFITIVGVPLGLIMTSLFISSIYISRVFPLIYVGRKILFKLEEKKLTWFFSVLIGVFLFTLISLQSSLKILLNLICIPAGFGALTYGRLKLFKRMREEKIL